MHRPRKTLFDHSLARLLLLHTYVLHLCPVLSAPPPIFSSLPWQLPAGCALLGDARVEGGSIHLGGDGGEGSVLLEADTPAAALPAMKYFEASWRVLALRSPFSELAAKNKPESMRTGAPVTRYIVDAQGVVNTARDEVGGGDPIGGYSLSMGDLHAAEPTGAGRRPFGRSGTGRGLRVAFSLSTAQLVPLTFGRCADQAVQPPCQRRLVRSDLIEVIYDRQVLPYLPLQHSTLLQRLRMQRLTHRRCGRSSRPRALGATSVTIAGAM